MINNYQKYNKITHFKKPKFVKIKDDIDVYSREFWYYRSMGQKFEVIGMKWDNYITHKRYHKACGSIGLVDREYICRLDCVEIK